MKQIRLCRPFAWRADRQGDKVSRKGFYNFIANRNLRPAAPFTAYSAEGFFLPKRFRPAKTISPHRAANR